MAIKWGLKTRAIKPQQLRTWNQNRILCALLIQLTLILTFMGALISSKEQAVTVDVKAAKEEQAVTVDVHAAKHLIGSGHRYLDVRTVEEFKKGHLEKALNIPYMFFTPEGRVENPDFVEQVSAVCNKKDLIIVGCQSGVRSLYATTDLLNAGFKHVKNMGGGYAAWVENKFAVNQSHGEL